MTEQTSDVRAIKLYFESGLNGKHITMDELRKLTKDERKELGDMCRKELT